MQQTPRKSSEIVKIPPPHHLMRIGPPRRLRSSSQGSDTAAALQRETLGIRSLQPLVFCCVLPATVRCNKRFIKKQLYTLVAERFPRGISSRCCVVGTGHAGLTLACELEKAGWNVVLLEAGGRDHSVTDESIASAAIDGQISSAKLHAAIFGGSSRIWGGLVAPLDKSDFGEGSYAPGRPFFWSIIAPYYRIASSLIGIDWEIFDEDSEGTKPLVRAGKMRIKPFAVSVPPINMKLYFEEHAEQGGRRLLVFTTSTFLVALAET